MREHALSLAGEQLVQLAMDVHQLPVAKLKALMEPAFEQAGLRKQQAGAVKSILVLLFDAVGDTVLTTGFMRELRRAYPQAYIAVLVRPGVAELWEFCPYINERILYDERRFQENQRKAWQELVALAEKHLWPRQFDLCISKLWGWAQLRNEIRLVEYLSGAKERVDFSNTVFNVYGNFEAKPDFAEELLTKPLVSPPECMHEAERIFYVLEALGHKPADISMEFWYSAADCQRVKDLLAGQQKAEVIYVALGLGAGTLNRKYPPTLLAKALNTLKARYPELCFVLLGGPSEQQAAEQLQEALPKGAAVNLAGKTRLRETGAAIDLCAMYIGNDTGTLHIAAALQKPVLAFFRDPLDKDDFLPGVFSGFHRFAPWQVPYIALRPDKAIGACKDEIIYGGCCGKEAHCITTISPDEVVAAFELLVKNT